MEPGLCVCTCARPYQAGKLPWHVSLLCYLQHRCLHKSYLLVVKGSCACWSVLHDIVCHIGSCQCHVHRCMFTGVILGFLLCSSTQSSRILHLSSVEICRSSARDCQLQLKNAPAWHMHASCEQVCTQEQHCQGIGTLSVSLSCQTAKQTTTKTLMLAQEPAVHAPSEDLAAVTQHVTVP